MAGLILLAAAVSVELVIAALGAASNDAHRGARALIRLAALASVGALAATGAITWGPRFYPFAAALLVLAVVATGRALLGPRRVLGPHHQPGPASRLAAAVPARWHAVALR